MNLEDIAISHDEILKLERAGKLAPYPPAILNRVRPILARTIHKAIRQFEFEGCPEVYDLSVHIDMMFIRLVEADLIKGWNKVRTVNHILPGTQRELQAQHILLHRVMGRRPQRNPAKVLLLYNSTLIGSTLPDRILVFAINVGQSPN